MGTKNRERRKAKQQKQRRSTHNTSPGGRAERLSEAEAVELMAITAVRALKYEDDATYRETVELLAAGPDIVDRSLFVFAQHAVGALWERGWQPADVVRAATREMKDRHVRFVTDVVAAQGREYPAVTIDEQWARQLSEIEAEVWWSHDHQYLEEWATRESASRHDVITWVIEFLAMSNNLPELPRLCRLPGQGHRVISDRAVKVEPRLLDKVRALLAKAEGTNFAEEAETFTAKAQEMMARHSIDRAMLAAHGERHDGPRARRVGVENPYEREKSVLLHVVAQPNSCRAIWSKHLGFSTVFGDEADIEMVEMLYTSLLVQATAAMTRSGSRTDQAGRSRTRSFRQSFLASYANRIGDRLAEATSAATAEAVSEVHGDRLLPVLVAREEAVEDAVNEAFPEQSKFSLRATNSEGWAAGHAAANLASLQVHGEVTERQSQAG